MYKIKLNPDILSLELSFCFDNSFYKLAEFIFLMSTRHLEISVKSILFPNKQKTLEVNNSKGLVRDKGLEPSRQGH